GRPAPASARGRERDGQLVRRLEEPEGDPLFLAPRVVVARATLAEAAVEAAREAAHRVADDEHERLAGGDVGKGHLVPVQQRSMRWRDAARVAASWGRSYTSAGARSSNAAKTARPSPGTSPTRPGRPACAASASGTDTMRAPASASRANRTHSVADRRARAGN